MNKHRNTALLLAILFLMAIPLLPSCEKDEDAPEPICLISSLNTSFEVICNGDTISGSQVVHITYDDQDRPIRWEEGGVYYVLFVYDSDGRLERAKEYYGEYEDHLVFTWDGQWVTKQWYWDEGTRPANFKNRIEFNADQQIVRVEGYKRDDGNYVLNWYDLYTWLNGNIVRIEGYAPDDPDKDAKDRRSIYAAGSFKGPWERRRDDAVLPTAPKVSKTTDFVLQSTASFTHDNKRNPFSLHPGWSLWAIWEMHYHSKNNLLRAEGISHQGDEGWLVTHEWEYNDQDYPTKMLRYIPDQDGCDYEVHIEIHYVDCE